VGGFEHPHDTPPYPFMPSPTFAHSSHAIRHQLCADCGVDVFARGKKPDGTDVVAVNVSCIDGIELDKLTMTPIDGKNR